MADEEIPLIPREEERGDEREGEERETSFGGGNVDDVARERGARPKTKTKTKKGSYVNPSYEEDKNEDIDAIVSKMLIGDDLTSGERERLKRFKEDEGIKIKTTTYENNTIEAGGYVGSIMISDKEGKKKLLWCS